MFFFVAVVLLAAQVAVAQSDGTILKRSGHAFAPYAQVPAIRWPEKISMPILIQHGSADQSVDPLQSIQMAARLQELKRPYELIIYDGVS